jgi:hypothetical protein
MATFKCVIIMSFSMLLLQLWVLYWAGEGAYSHYIYYIGIRCLRRDADSFHSAQ